MKSYYSLSAFCAVGLFIAFPVAAQAGLIGHWPMEAGSGATAFNLAGGTDGTISNVSTGGLGGGGQAWIPADPQRGTVLSFNGNDGSGAFVDAGTIPQAIINGDFTLSYWAALENAGTGGSDVIIGNRYGGPGGGWTKATPTKFEWRPGAGEGDADHPDIAQNGSWHHYAVVKSGTNFTTYQDGAPTATNTLTGTFSGDVPFFFGGDPGGERIAGRMDEVAAYDAPLAANQISHLAFGGSVSALPAPAGPSTIESLADDFSAPVIDAAKWSQMPSDFEAGTGTYSANTTTNPGELTIAGVNDLSSYWGGLVLQSFDTFDAGKPAGITVDRVSLGGNAIYRSSLWIKQTDGTYLHYAQNVNEGGWQYNPNNTGGGTNIGSLDGLDGSTGLHKMSLAYIPLGGNNARIEMYLDGAIAAVHNFSGDWENGTDFYVRLSGMARQATTDTVDARFDNFAARSVDVAVSQATQNNSTGFTVSSSDLLEGLTATVTGGTLGGQEGTSADPAVLTNGTFGPADMSNPGEVVSISNNTTLTYQLDTSAGPWGFDLTGIDTYTGWRDPGRDAQDYTVLYSTVDEPDLFLPLEFVSYNPGGAPNPSDTAVFLTEASGGILASRVSGIRFAFASTELGYVGYRELDVFGNPTPIPEPSTFALAALGLLALGLVGWRRRR